MANYLTVALFSIMVFYSFGIAINVHRTLDKENAGKLLRKLFPIYFLWGIFISILAEVIFLLKGQQEQAFIMAIIVIGYLYSRQILVPKINESRDLANGGDERSKIGDVSIVLASSTSLSPTDDPDSKPVTYA